MTTTQTINDLIRQATKAGFESYGNYRTEEDHIQYESMTCTKGEFDGEVIEIHYEYNSGEVTRVEQYCQFPENHPHHSPIKFKFQ